MEMRLSRQSKTFLCWILFSLIQHFQLTEALGSDFHSPRSAALGGAGHAGPLLNDAIYLNPSFTSLLPTYSISGNFLWFNNDQDFHGKSLNGSIQDGRTELFQAGVGYTLLERGKFIHVGISKSAARRFSIGLGAKFFFPADKSRTQIIDSIASASLIAAKWLQVVAVVDNVRASAEAREKGFEREFILGTKLNLAGAVLVYFDPHWIPALSQGSFGHETGLELTVFSDIFIRMGTFRNSTIPFVGARGRGYGFGVGWIAPRISIDFGMERALEPIPVTAQTIGMTIFF